MRPQAFAADSAGLGTGSAALKPVARLRVVATAMAPQEMAPQENAPAPSLALAGVAITAQPRSTWRDHIALLAALSIAVAAHLGMLAMLSRQLDATVGAGGTDLTAVSMEITIVASPALAGLGEPGTNEPATDALAGLQADSVAAPPADAAAQPAPEGPAQGTLEPTAAATPTSPPTPMASDTTPHAAVVTGSLPTMPVASGTPSSAGSASPGLARAYAATVVQALGKSRPKAVAGLVKGTVRVVFALDEEGTLDFVRVARSSGQPALDAAAIMTVQKARFAPPPQGLTSVDRTYEIPFYFK